MTFFPRDETVQRLKAVADIVQIIGEHVQLRKSGANYQGLCPFHSEKTPSFMVNPARRWFHCFGCGEGGDIFKFLMLYHRQTFPEVLKNLAARYQVELPQMQLSSADKEKLQKKEALFEVNEKAALLYHHLLLENSRAEPARAYLKKRGIPEELAARFRLGFAPESWDFLLRNLSRSFTPTLLSEAGLLIEKEQGGYFDRFRNRLLFPITDLSGRVVAFSGRLLRDGQPKYLNSPESPLFSKSHTLFGMAQNRDNIRRSGTCLIVEGNFDMLSLVAHGVDNVVAPLGTALTAAHLRILKGYAGEAVLLFDGDAAGLKAAMRLVPLFLSEQLSARVAILPSGHDPDTFIRSHGREELTKLLTRALPLSDFVFTSLAERHGLGLEGKGKIISELQPLLLATPDRTQQSLFASHFAQKLGIPSEELMDLRERRPQAGLVPKNGRELDLPLKQKQLLEFLICHPGYLQEFLTAGVEEVLASAAARNIIKLLRMQAEDSPEALLENLEPGPERSFISRILLAAPSFSTAETEEVAAGMRDWLIRVSAKSRKEQLIRQMDQAFKARDELLCLQLQERIREVDRLLSP
jgi:DNA primase